MQGSIEKQPGENMESLFKYCYCYSYYCCKWTIALQLQQLFIKRNVAHYNIPTVHAEIEDNNYRDFICWISVAHP